MADVETNVCEPVQEVQGYTCECPRSQNMSRRRRTSPSCVSKWFVGVTRRIRRYHKKRLVVLSLPIVLDVRFGHVQMTEESILQFVGE